MGRLIKPPLFYLLDLWIDVIVLHEWEKGMKTVVITGSTRGIGLGLAKEFLNAGCQVILSGRNEQNVQTLVSDLSLKYPQAKVAGKTCEVTDRAQVQALWEYAKSLNPTVDIWINNAGIGHDRNPFNEIPAQCAQDVLHTNLDGLLNGCSIALKGMQAQGSGAIYNMLGLGSDGRRIKGLSVYGMSKAAASYFSRALIAETRGGNVLVGSLSPGMVLTDLLLNRGQYSISEWATLKKVYNFLAEKVEVVTPWLVTKILANQKHGVEIRYLNPLRLGGHAILAMIGKRNLFREE